MLKRRMALLEQLRNLELLLVEMRRVIDNPESSPLEVQHAKDEIVGIESEIREIKNCFSDNNPLLERYWIPRSGEPIKIKDMSEAHAKNALAFVMDKISEGHPVWVDKMGMFKYNPTKRRRPPVTIKDVESIVSMIEFMKKMVGGRSN